MFNNLIILHGLSIQFQPKRVEDFVTTEVVEQQSNQSPDESVSATIPDDEVHFLLISPLLLKYFIF